MYELPHELPNDISRKSLAGLKLMAISQPVSERPQLNSCARKLQQICCKTFRRNTYLKFCEFIYNTLSMNVLIDRKTFNLFYRK